jgi:uncharacterized protein (UPF0333 family)
MAALIASAVVAASIAVCMVAYLSRTACLAVSAAVASDGMVALMSSGANSSVRAFSAFCREQWSWLCQC